VIGGSHTNTPSLTHEQATAQERGSVRGRKHQDCTRYCSRSSVIKEKEKRKTKLSYILKFTKNCQIPHRKLGPSRKRHWLGGGTVRSSNRRRAGVSVFPLLLISSGPCPPLGAQPQSKRTWCASLFGLPCPKSECLPHISSLDFAILPFLLPSNHIASLVIPGADSPNGQMTRAPGPIGMVTL